jgi:Haloacid dehalogenase-like hydrolase
MDKPSNAHETALAMEIAKHRLADDSDASTPTPSSGVTTPEADHIPTTDKYAFAFDIDGVLIRGGEVIPEAIDALKMLNGDNEFDMKVYVPLRSREYFKPD